MPAPSIAAACALLASLWELFPSLAYGITYEWESELKETGEESYVAYLIRNHSTQRHYRAVLRITTDPAYVLEQARKGSPMKASKPTGSGGASGWRSETSPYCASMWAIGPPRATPSSEYVRPVSPTVGMRW